MAEKRKRSQNFSAEEKDRLVKLLGSHKATILNKKTDGTSNEAKNKAWGEVTEAFNATATIFRTKESLIKIWDKMKSESKIYYQTSRRSMNKTGGGPMDIRIDPVLEQVCALLGRACTGIEGVQDSDFDNNILYSKVPRLDLETSSVATDLIIPQIVVSEADEPVTIEIVPSTSQGLTNQDVTTSETPLWSRRRPQISHNTERAEAMSSLCSSYQNVNKKKEDIEELKKQLLLEEIEFKRKLYKLQLAVAEKELAIKTEVLNQLLKGDSTDRNDINK